MYREKKMSEKMIVLVRNNFYLEFLIFKHLLSVSV